MVYIQQQPKICQELILSIKLTNIKVMRLNVVWYSILVHDFTDTTNTKADRIGQVDDQVIGTIPDHTREIWAGGHVWHFELVWRWRGQRFWRSLAVGGQKAEVVPPLLNTQPLLHIWCEYTRLSIYGPFSSSQDTNVKALISDTSDYGHQVNLITFHLHYRPLMRSTHETKFINLLLLY